MFELTPEEWTAIRLSLRIAIVATAGRAAASASRWRGCWRARNFWGKSLLDGLIVLPLVLPPVVTGYLLLIWFGRRGPVGSFLTRLSASCSSFRWTGAALACGIMAFPLLVRPIRLSFEAIDRELEDAAATLGANAVLALRHGDAAARAARHHRRHACSASPRRSANSAPPSPSCPTFPGETQTISAAIYTYTQVPGGDAAALRLVIVAIVIAMAALLASEFFARRATRRLHGE